MQMSLANNKTQELWKSFMPRLKEIENIVGQDLYSMQVYRQLPDFNNFSPETEFIKWAAKEVVDFSVIPEGLEQYELNGGLYAVFIHRGLPSEFQKTFYYIFGEWLPGSAYEIDNREHFEVLGEKYKNNDPESEEEIWIPVKEKS